MVRDASNVTTTYTVRPVLVQTVHEVSGRPVVVWLPLPKDADEVTLRRQSDGSWTVDLPA